MNQKKHIPDAERERKQKELHRDIAQRQKSYRGRALALFPHICAHCCREFSGKRLKELTVHHKDHDHNNNPEDGSNWELLCIYCHDHEHEKYRMKGYSGGENKSYQPETDVSPFADLDKLINKQE